MHLAIAGNIGAGKTTLTALLAKHFQYRAHYERVDDNPYLDDFYHDMPRWSFNLQIFFLQSRFAQQLAINAEVDKPELATYKGVVQDRTIYEDAEIFAPNLHDMGLLNERDYQNYRGLFELMVTQVRPPDLMIYLKASVPTLVSNIQKRGRDFEKTIRLDYLQTLNERYEAWTARYSEGPIVTIDMDGLDFENKPEHLGRVFEQVQGASMGLFPTSGTASMF